MGLDETLTKNMLEQHFTSSQIYVWTLGVRRGDDLYPAL